MKKLVRKTTLYICEVCKTEYTKKKDALKCEAKLLERKVFHAGDIVRNKNKRTCSKKMKKYILKGKVVRVLGPISISDNRNHIFQYEIKYICPACNQEKQALYNASELKLIPR